MLDALIFSRGRPGATDEVNLVFGEGASIDLNEVRINGSLPAITVQVGAIGTCMVVVSGALPAITVAARAVQTDAAVVQGRLRAPTFLCDLGLVTGVQMVASLPGLQFKSTLGYQTNTQRPVVGRVGSIAQVALPREWGITHIQSHAKKTSTGFEMRGGDARMRSERLSAAYAEGLKTPIASVGVFQDGRLTVVALQGLDQEGDRRWLRFEGVFQEGIRVAGSRLAGGFQEGLNDRRVHLVNRFEEARRLPAWRYRGVAYPAVPKRRGWIGAFEEAWVPRPGVHLLPVEPSVPSRIWGTQLVFACPPLFKPILVFGLLQCQPAPAPVATVPVRKVYLVINDVTLHRTVDNIAVPVHSLSLSLDVSSWAWGFEADLPLKALEMVEGRATGGPVELMASVNGTQFRLLAENISRERVFGESSIHVSGRGHNAVLAAPYAPVMSFANPETRTARQLMDDVLTVNGVSMGWSVDWGLTDWNVPAGVFARQGTWIEALTAIASAAGGYVLPDRVQQRLRVRHRYPVAPWDFAGTTPDIVLPVDAVQRESLRWLEKPAYNRVFVSGQETGVLAQVTRSGTAGDVLAPMVVDSLITEATAARQRGLAVLSDTGRQLGVSLRLPVLIETGIIEPGTFVQYVDGIVTRIGLVRASSVQAGFPEVWQRIEVEVPING